MHAATRITALAAIAILAAGLAGCSDDAASPAAPAPVVVDTAPPAVPVGLSAAVADLKLKLQWQANTTDPDLAGYLVYEMAFGGVHALTDEPVRDARWVDADPPTNPCDYAVTAVDAAGNESAWATVHFAGAPTPPQRDAGIGWHD